MEVFLVGLVIFVVIMIFCNDKKTEKPKIITQDIKEIEQEWQKKRFSESLNLASPNIVKLIYEIGCAGAKSSYEKLITKSLNLEAQTKVSNINYWFCTLSDLCLTHNNGAFHVKDTLGFHCEANWTYWINKNENEFWEYFINLTKTPAPNP